MRLIRHDTGSADANRLRDMQKRVFVTVIASGLAALCLLLAGPALADDAPGPNDVTDNDSETHSATASAPVDSPVGTDPADTTTGQEIPDPDPSGSTAGEDVPDGDLYSRGGHDKCKKHRNGPLPQWCFGLSSWPLFKEEPIHFNPAGICGASSVHPLWRCRHWSTDV
jgi:hypothetical protein